ncbi:hypothetical protein PLICRDRAFT_702353 [Plicaturopsis crispa FD-325 SS-3]|uniref:Multidrug resistance-associated ABC transporter n=1 Tax=Plicaturopsis crispa FD-325 SS-3 TaxID=944288 RepID=A0A0C9T6S0_PLICR|nr:hypothetical protein PLICRDRAFT_702353 [Plicaturopsis crispa FD-325 SS-3]
MGSLCDTTNPFDFRDACVRSTWAAFFPAVLVALFCISSVPLPLPKPIRGFVDSIKAPFRTFLTLPEAEALDEDNGDVLPEQTKAVTPLWRTVVLSWIALVEALIWLAIGSFNLITRTENDSVWSGVLPILTAVSWLYAAARPVWRPAPTPPYDLFALYCVHLVFGVLLLGGVLFDRQFGVPLPGTIRVVGMALNLAAIVGLLSVVLMMPLAIPSSKVKKEDIGVTVSPDDYTTLFGWITFSWVYPLIKRGTNATLNEKDVWELSPALQSRPVFIKFSSMKRATLIRQLVASNTLDLFLDFFLTFVSVIFNYAGPFFLKRILDAIDHPTPESRARAYVYAFLAFLCMLFKAQADVQHLWFGRRAATRMRMELMAAIYDKALKRKDYSGIVDKEKLEKVKTVAEQSKMTKEEAKKAADKKDDPKAGADTGKIVNLMAGDANRIAQMVSGAYFIYGAPIEVIIGSIFLYQLLGWSAFAGFVVLVIGWPLNSLISKRSIRIQKGVLAARDKRMGVLNELIGSVKFIKFFAWEERWIQRALDSREVEMGWMVKARVNSVLFSLLWMTAPILVSVVAFFTYVARGNELTVPIAFTSIALFNMIRQPLNVIPTWIIQILQTGVALNRIATFLGEDEVSEQISSLKKPRNAPSADNVHDEGLGIENGTFKWNEIEVTQEKDSKDKGKNKSASTASEETAVEEPTGHRFELKDISIKFPEGKLTCVTGPTASGKTALLMALLGELTLIEGRLIMSKDSSSVDENGLAHTISYAAQSPWLRHQSIKDNILFGYPYDEERYNAVVDCCALRPDLDILEDGDQTEIGARGVSLSGGQKARVALARAVYAHTKYVLLDDPLSAVDSHTARSLFDKLFRGPLLANRTVILVTHHVELVLPGTQYLVRMLDGRIDSQGTVEELRAQGILDDITHEASVEVQEEEQAVLKKEEPTDAVEALPAEPTDAEPTGEAKKPKKLIKDEHRETGGVKWNIYNSYLKASSYWTWGILAFIVVISQLLGITEKLWIKTWGEAYGPEANLTASYAFNSFATAEHEVSMDGILSFPQHSGSLHGIEASSFTTTTLPRAQDHPLFYVGVYAAIALLTATASIISVIVQYTGALRASRIMFQQLLVGVVRATMRWHDVTPQGRMLNRFGKDVETIDSSLASSLQAVNSSLATFFAAILTVAVVFPWFLIPAFIIGTAYRRLAIGYLNTGRDLRRMESNSRSPIFSGFGELLEGIVTVRAFSAEKRFLDGLHSMIDATTKQWVSSKFAFWMTNRWLLLNFDGLGAIAVFVTTLFALSGFVSAGIAGLCITSAMAFTTSIYWACRFWTALELDLNSVERIVEYLDLPQEPPAVIESNRPPAYWPSSSSKDSLIHVEDLVIKYAPDLPPVLHGVSFDLKAKERIGLLGRTGSGKSTLAMSILRFVDPVSGRILIDGIDISTIGVHDLRTRITFIPQDATLFSGTLRDNLDPFGDHEDSECLDVLFRVQMISESAYQSQKTSREPSRAPSIHEGSSSSVAPTVVDADTKTKISLDTQVSAGGTNFSQGQRQLIAMARALLRRSSIIVLDEATSSIDFATDAKIQATIREEFGDSLLLTVAHRIKTVIDYDRLIVLDKGQIAEFDTPHNLIQKEDGIFRNMCLKSGTFADLEAAAKAKAEGDQTKKLS